MIFPHLKGKLIGHRYCDSKVYFILLFHFFLTVTGNTQ